MEISIDITSISMEIRDRSHVQDVLSATKKTRKGWDFSPWFDPHIVYGLSPDESFDYFWRGAYDLSDEPIEQQAEQ